MKTLSIIVAFTLSVTSVFAADYPERNIFMVVPYAAGGPTDTIARLTADAMSKSLGQQIVVENVAGAGGTIGARRVADADPDGYTILVHHIGMATAPALYRQLPYKPTEAFEPIGLVSDAAMTVIARSEFPAETFQELVAYIKQNGNKVNYAHAGIGAASHLCGTLFMATIGTQMTTVPYKGNGPIMTDLIGGQIDMTCTRQRIPSARLRRSKSKPTRSPENNGLTHCPTCQRRPRPDCLNSNSASGMVYTRPEAPRKTS